ncbi:PREDICTED: baculoviral IAP repeat-containing protein 5-like, partial [Acanthisitta chloris]|uniref:baculoviral IAP repeat-containing protein 5-like n=1 Tax=Acanthisitta chloris TaxID=57068 RepID=UPI0004F0ED89
EEHRKHSAECAFLSLQKDPDSLTLQEFLKLDKMRIKKSIVRTRRFGKERNFVEQSTVSEELCCEMLQRDGVILDKVFDSYRAQANCSGL